MPAAGQLRLCSGDLDPVASIDTDQPHEPLPEVRW